MEQLAAVRRPSADALYNNWTHAYGIEALVRCLKRHARRRRALPKIRELDRRSRSTCSGRYECVDGGWCYYDFDAHTQEPSGSTISFVTATVLVALREAKDAGVGRAAAADGPRPWPRSCRQRNPDFSYDYGEYLKYAADAPGQSARRQPGPFAGLQPGDAALGRPKVTDEVLDHLAGPPLCPQLWLDMGRKRPIPHESWFQVAGYFFYYGHYYAALCIEQLPAAERPPVPRPIGPVLLPLQEKDGSWWDFPLYDYHQQYGTAFALMALGRCRPRGCSPAEPLTGRGAACSTLGIAVGGWSIMKATTASEARVEGSESAQRHHLTPGGEGRNEASEVDGRPDDAGRLGTACDRPCHAAPRPGTRGSLPGGSASRRRAAGGRSPSSLP